MPLAAAKAVIGRSPTAAVALESANVSWHHAAVWQEGGAAWIEDLGSTNGTFVDGQPILAGVPVPFCSDSRVQVGSWTFKVVGQAPPISVPDASPHRIMIGRSPDSHVRLTSPKVSWHHAEAIWVGDAFQVSDLGSTNGICINGHPCRAGNVGPQDVLTVAGEKADIFRIGHHFSSGHHLHARAVLEARQISVSVPTSHGPITLLTEINLIVAPGELTAVLGKSGCGKTTLVQVLAGLTEPSQGQVLLNGVRIDGTGRGRGLIGFVPQGNILPLDLPLEEALYYCAKLRMPDGTPERTISKSVAEGISRMDLASCSKTALCRLSGGELKRANVAAELLTQPSVLILDEPGSGLDAGAHKRLLNELRRLAAQGQSVIVVTHNVEGLSDFSQVVVLVKDRHGRGGRLAFQGPPKEALAFFSVSDFGAVYDQLDSSLGHATRFISQTSETGPRTIKPPARPLPMSGPSFLTSLITLSRRSFACLSANQKNLAIQLLQAPVIGLLLLAPFGPAIVSTTQKLSSDGTKPVQDLPLLLFIIAFACCCTALFTGAREVVKERDLILRERQLGVLPIAIIGSKVVFCGALTAVQSLLILGVVTSRIPIFQDAAGFLAGWAILALAGLASACLGLLLSSATKRVEHAITAATGLSTVLVLVSGLLRLERLGILTAAAQINPLRWGYGGLSGVTDAPDRLEGAGMGRLVHEVIQTEPSSAVAVLAIILFFTAGLACLCMMSERNLTIR